MVKILFYLLTTGAAVVVLRLLVGLFFAVFVVKEFSDDWAPSGARGKKQSLPASAGEPSRVQAPQSPQPASKGLHPAHV